MATEFDTGGAAAGAMSGAAAGSVAGPWGTAAGAVVGGVVGGFAGGGKKKSSGGFDINAILSQIRAEYAKARVAAIQSINAQAVTGRQNVIQNLANSGILRSGASANQFERLEAARIGAIGESEGKLAAMQAGQFAELLLGLNKQRISQDELEAKRRAERTGALTGIGSTLLLAALRSRSPGSTTLENGQLPKDSLMIDKNIDESEFGVRNDRNA